MNGKFEGVNRRIDDMSMNRVKYEDRSKLKSRVDFIEGKMKREEEGKRGNCKKR